MTYFQTELELLIKSSCSFIYILTNEEERLESIIKNIAFKDVKQGIYCWDFIQGFHIGSTTSSDTKTGQRNPLQALDFIESFNHNSDAIFLLKDFNLFLKDFSAIRKIRNLSRKLDVCNQVVIISGMESDVPAEVKHLMHFLALPLPNKYEINLELKRLIGVLELSNFNDRLQTIASICQGLSINQIRRLISQVLIKSSAFDSTYLQQLQIEKQKYIRQTSLLEISRSEVSLNDIGGIDNLKEWLLIRSKAFSESSLNYGLPYPKGLLLLGIQGTGKSLTAKAIAKTWNLMLLRLDIGKLFAGVVGQSESNTRLMIQVVEASAPCVLWIDEIDKAFSKSLIGGDSGTNNRVLATLLTWLSDKTSPVFIVATANSITDLPAEIIRKGRFDEIFFLNLPSCTERQKIFQIHLQKVRPDTWHRYNLQYLAKYSRLFSGAEINQVIVEAMHSAFIQNRDFTSLDLLNAIDAIIPLAFTDSHSVQKIQQLANLGKVRIASSQTI
uniref:Uncharacterized AAA domain-containing protein ycf46 n=1 Tax=Hommersandiophycus borowitzkae TaxID=268573 RepID=A0A1G4NU67_9FLOR|nr:Hypothetical protein ycf46 [Hommersandiophycus borowitzkae]SCW22096.1 Hypothetical protein ycf46 [Hommersandiophycus borowitzkae]